MMIDLEKLLRSMRERLCERDNDKWSLVSIGLDTQGNGFVRLNGRDIQEFKAPSVYEAIAGAEAFLSGEQERLVDATLGLPGAMSGWVVPPDETVSAEYWLTRRDADAAPGYETGLPDIRQLHKWNHHFRAWGTTRDDCVMLHSNNGWRLEEPAQ